MAEPPTTAGGNYYTPPAKPRPGPEPEPPRVTDADRELQTSLQADLDRVSANLRLIRVKFGL